MATLQETIANNPGKTVLTVIKVGAPTTHVVVNNGTSLSAFIGKYGERDDSVLRMKKHLNGTEVNSDLLQRDLVTGDILTITSKVDNGGR